MKRSIYILFNILLLISTVHAQEKPGYYGTEIINIDLGLSNNVTTALLEDHNGLIWVGTEYGINIFDGHFVKSYVHSSKKNSISGNIISCLYQDKQRRIWIGTLDNGLCYYDFRKKIFHDFNTLINPKDTILLDPYISGTIRTVIEDDDDNLWIGSFNGLVKFNLNNKTFTIFNQESDGNKINHNQINCFFLNEQKQMFIGTKKGLNIFDPKTGKINSITFPNNSNSNPYITTLKPDKNGHLWIGTRNNGLFRYDLRKNTIERADFILENESVWEIVVDNFNRLWVSAHYFLFMYDLDTKELVNTSSLNINPQESRIYNQMIHTKNGYILATTNGLGLMVFDPYATRFDVYKYDPFDENSIKNNMIISIANNEDNTALIGTQSGWVHKFDPEKESFLGLEFVRNTNYQGDVLCLYKSDKDIYAGTYLYGMIKTSSTGNQIIFKPDLNNKQALADGDIRTISKKDDNTLWVGTNEKGLYEFNTTTNTFTFVDQWEGIGALSVKEDRKGNIWVASYNGLKVFKKKNYLQNNIYRYNKYEAGTISHNRVTDILVALDETLYVSTMGGGLNIFNYSDSSFSHIGTYEGLPSMYINSILEDNDGNIWMGTSNGLSVYDPKTSEVRNYFESDGLPNNIFNIRSTAKLDNGEIIMGTQNGLIRFNPHDIKGSNPPSKLFLVSFFINGERILLDSKSSPLDVSVPEIKHITLNSDQSNFAFKYSVLTFSNLTQTQYYYKLSPLQNDWIYNEHDQMATFNAVPPGEYTFHLKVYQNGLLKDTIEPIKITIKEPAIWSTSWFKVLIFLMITFILLGIFIFRTKNIEDKNKILESSNKELDQFAYIVSHDLKAPLRAITNLTDWIEEDINDKSFDEIPKNFSLLRSRVHRMEMLISGILSYSRISKNTIKPDIINVKSFLNELISTIEVPESFTITIPNKLPTVTYPKVRLEQVFINLLTNAIKYHDKAHGTIEVGYKLTGNKHEFSVRDDGPGIDPKYHDKIFMIFQTLQSKDVYESTGIGLTIVKKIIEDQGGSIRVESEVGSGTSFVFTIPVNPNSDK